MCTNEYTPGDYSATWDPKNVLMLLCTISYFVSVLDNKAPKAEDIEEEDDDVPGKDDSV